MGFYNVWHPSLISRQPPVLELLLTLGGGTQMGRGTDEFVRQLLIDCQIDPEFTGWELLACRCSYFSDYSEDWEDRWPPAWRIEVELVAEPSLPEPEPLGWIESDAHDASWQPEMGIGLVGSAVCLVIADFLTETQFDAARSRITTQLDKADLRGKPTVIRAAALSTYPQLQVTLGEFSDDFYEQDAPLARDLIAICEEMGGRVNYRHVFSQTTG